MSERGRFIVDRCVFEEPLLRDPEQFRAWLWLVSEAAWQPRSIMVSNGRAEAVLQLQRGQLSYSLTYMAKAWNVSVKRVRTILRRFETGSLIGTQTGTLQTIITICNYDASQSLHSGEGTQTGTQTGTQRARKGHETNTLNTLNKEGGIVIKKPERKPEDFTDNEWLDRLKMLKQDGAWSSYWGPKPGEPGSLVPTRLVMSSVAQTSPSR